MYWLPSGAGNSSRGAGPEPGEPSTATRCIASVGPSHCQQPFSIVSTVDGGTGWGALTVHSICSGPAVAEAVADPVAEAVSEGTGVVDSVGDADAVADTEALALGEPSGEAASSSSSSFAVK